MTPHNLELGAAASAADVLADAVVQPTQTIQQPVALVSATTEADVPAEEAETGPVDASAFAELGLAPQLVQAVADLGYSQPTQVQQKAIPLAMDATTGFVDLMVSSQTGSGKTAAFLLPVLHTLLKQQEQEQAEIRAEFDRLAAEAIARGEQPPKRNRRKDPTHPRNFKPAVPGALILCPTRELAQQVAQDAIGLVSHCKGLRIACVMGGTPYQIQVARLQNANLVVATPGRLLDLQRGGQLQLDKVQFLVVDEADRMLDLGFSDDLADINQLTSQRQQTMMFSATFAPRIQQLAMRVMHDGGSQVKKIQIDTPHEKHANIKQVLHWADNPQHKRQLLDHWLRDASIQQAIVFSSTQIECDGLAQELQDAGFSAVALHGALSQGLRNRRLMALRKGQVQFLVATDVAARGIDVPTISHVFNFGLPMKAEDYTHRIGRTGRAGRDGLAITFAEFRDRHRIADIEGYSQQSLVSEVIPGMEPTQRFPQPGQRDQRGGSRFGGRGGDRRGGGGFGGGNRGGFGDRGGFGGRGGDRGPRFDRDERPARHDPRFESSAPQSEGFPRGDRFGGDNRGGNFQGGERAPFQGRGRSDDRAPRFAGRDGGGAGAGFDRNAGAPSRFEGRGEGGGGRWESRGPRPEGGRPSGGGYRGDAPRGGDRERSGGGDRGGFRSPAPAGREFRHGAGGRDGGAPASRPYTPGESRVKRFER